MRKAVQAAIPRRNSQRRNKENNNSSAEGGGGGAVVLKEASPSSSSSDIKRKTSPEETTLTAKNYRLAKELSELRVRHREECKNVTRLTMENMNLASRCREALSHVAMLKRELASHQRRSAEALAMQRQNSESTSRAALSPPVAVPVPSHSVTSPVSQPSKVETTPTRTPPQPSQKHATTPVSAKNAEITIVTTPNGGGGGPRSSLAIPKLSSPVVASVAATTTTSPAHISTQHAPDPPQLSTPPPKLTPRRAVDVAKELELLDETVASYALKAKEAATTIGSSTTVTTPAATSSSPAMTAPTSTPQPTDPSSPAMTAPTSTPQPTDLDEPVDSDDYEEEVLVAAATAPPAAAPTQPFKAPISLDDYPGHRPSPATAEKTGHSTLVVAQSPPRGSTLSSITLASPSRHFFPHSASPKLDNYNEEYPADLAVVRKRTNLRSKLGSLVGMKEGEDEGSSYGTGKKSSLDAFEASFATDFPDTFSPRETTIEEKKSEIYNPFHSPTKSKSGPGRVDADPRKDPPGKSRTSQRSSSMHNKVFTALSRSPRPEERNSSRLVPPSVPTAPKQSTSTSFRQNILAKSMNSSAVDTKKPETGRSRFDRLSQIQQQRRIVPIDDPGTEAKSLQIEPPGSPRRTQEPEEQSTTPVSVKDRASLFKGGSPLTPEMETVRLNSLNNRYSERSFVDEGDIPMVSSIGRSKATPRQDSPGTPDYSAGAPRSPSYTSNSANFGRGRGLPWEDDGTKDEMESRRGRLYESNKLRRSGDLYSGKEDKNERE